MFIIAAEGSTPNLDMKVSRSLDPVFRADLCIGEIEILCLSRCRKYDFMNLQAVLIIAHPIYSSIMPYLYFIVYLFVYLCQARQDEEV